MFHYEFEFIHPFADSNGRLGRLWQTLILSLFNPLLAQLPVESMIHKHQSEYYRAINSSTHESDSAPFIEFMLAMILEAIDNTLSASTPQDKPQATLQAQSLLHCFAKQSYALSRDEIQALLSLKDRKSFRKRYLKPVLDAGFIEMTFPEKPNSPLQHYRLTSLGREFAR